MNTKRRYPYSRTDKSLSHGGMLSLTQFAAIARQYGVPFEVQFTAQASFVWVGGGINSWRHPGTKQPEPFLKALLDAGARMRHHDSGMRMTLESLT